MNDRIAFVTTGGTIGSILRGGSRAVEPGGEALRTAIAALCENHSASYEVRSPVNLASEDFDPGTWALIAASVRDCLDAGIDKIVVTHGTDTLCYTATALAMLFAGRRARICLTGAFRGPDHPRTDVGFSLSAALEAVLFDAVPDGVHVALPEAARPRRAAVIQGLDVKPIAFDEAGVRSRYDRRVAEYSVEDGIVACRAGDDGGALVLALDDRPLPAPTEVQARARRIHFQPVYPGLDLEGVLGADRSVDAVVLGLYHSGTASGVDPPGSILGYLRRKVRPPVLMGALPVGHVPDPYASTVSLIAAGANVYGDVQAHQLYAMLALGLAQERSVEDVLKLLDPYRIAAV